MKKNENNLIPIPMYFAVSTICNLRCGYCYLSEDKKSTKIDDEKVKNSIIQLQDKMHNEGYCIDSFAFHGAEPTMLKPETIGYVVNELTSNKKNTLTHCRMMTNGTLLTMEYLKRILKVVKSPDNLSISVSIDGDKELHNKNRDNSWTKSMVGLRNAKSLGFYTTVSIVISKDSLNCLQEIGNFIKSMKKLSIFVQIKMIEGAKCWTTDEETLIRAFLNDNELYGSLNILRNNICSRQGNSCVYYEFAVDGKVFSCNKAFDDKNSFANWKIDTISNVIQKRKLVYKDKDINPECLKCEVYDKCKGGCPLDRNADNISKYCFILKDKIADESKKTHNNISRNSGVSDITCFCDCDSDCSSDCSSDCDCDCDCDCSSDCDCDCDCDCTDCDEDGFDTDCDCDCVATGDSDTGDVTADDGTDCYDGTDDAGNDVNDTGDIGSWDNASDEEGTITNDFTNEETGQIGTISFNETTNDYNVSYDDGTGHGFSNDLNDGNGGSYSYGDVDGDGVADASYNYGDTSLFGGLFGKTIETQEYRSATDGKFDGGTMTSFINDQLAYTEQYMSTDGYEVAIGREEFSWLSPTSWLDGIVADVSINGYDIGILGDIGYAIGGYFGDDESALTGGQIGAVLGIAIDVFVGVSMITAGNMMIGVGKWAGSTQITVAGYTSLIGGMVSVVGSLSDLNDLFGGYSDSISGVADFMDSDSQNKDWNKAYKEAVKEAFADMRSRTLYASSVYDGSVYDKMAGGRTYNNVMSGSHLWGATKPANTSFSVGVPLKLGRNVVRSNFPYSKYAGSYNKNLAGDSTFSVLKFKG